MKRHNVGRKASRPPGTSLAALHLAALLFTAWRGAGDLRLAGVERVFSAAGKMHGDLQKSAKDSTLEHSLFAAFNTD